ncbi:MAG: hypothetical protein Q7T55_20700 [Solirubrobacteraceae bacterium]|nr:hypothetical protein [Solirubrobacteraceae bacterium]
MPSATSAPVTSSPLAAGASYVVTVSGTASIWPITGGSICGAPEATIVEPSPGAASSQATFDAETVFGANMGAVMTFSGSRACSGFSLPNSNISRGSGFQIRNGGGFANPIAFGGTRTTPRADHTYSYELTGTGAPAAFRFLDSPTNDNSGIFSIVVRTATECGAVNCLGNQAPQADQLSEPVSRPSPGTISVVNPITTDRPGTTCTLDKVLSVRLNPITNQRLSRVVYYLNGKKLRTVSGRKNYILSTKSIRAQKFRNLPSGVLNLRASVQLASGRKYQVQRAIQRCQPRIKARPIE